MPSSRPSERFNDIIANIDAIGRYTSGMTEAQYRADPKTIDATERCLTRISEAASKLGMLAEEFAPDQPWADIRGIGNRFRHEYDKIDKSELWRIITDDLPSLRAACERSIQRLHEVRERDPGAR